MALEGNLQDMSLVDLFRIFRMGQKTGRLMLIGQHERGIVYTAAGRLIDAVVVEGAGRQIIAAGEAAVVHVLQWDNAKFNFQHDASLIQRQVRITRDNMSLMLEGLRRRARPLALPSHQRITLDTQLELAPLTANADRSIRLDLSQWQLLNQIATSQNLRTFCKRNDMASEAAIRLASELVAIGLMDIVDEPHAAHTPTPTPRMAINQRSAIAVGGRALPTERSLFNAVMRRVRDL